MFRKGQSPERELGENKEIAVMAFISQADTTAPGYYWDKQEKQEQLISTRASGRHFKRVGFGLEMSNLL